MSFAVGSARAILSVRHARLQQLDRDCPSTRAPSGRRSRCDARRAPDVEGPVVAGAVAHERLDDVEERLVARADQAVGEVVRMRRAALARNRVDRLDAVGAHLVEARRRERDDLRFLDAGLAAPRRCPGRRRRPSPAAMLRSVSSSMFFTSRACSITCWPSRTSIPSFCSSNSIGGSTTSRPSGMSPTPSASRIALISRRRVAEQRDVAARPRRACRAAPRWQWSMCEPRRVQAVVLGRASRNPRCTGRRCR